ncbi:helix-turn-helix transcriptional regulator [Cupriavidus consociatus]|uniref:helix-turn-helix transcriptional regulator n=1 Tax=Cupriavidus consociatus TaxID=2821357 RepID=UPI001FD83167|nr:MULTISPECIES: helix-turn-helix transcriptional regulator [unclassified Cupriavidus]MDK2661441.1 LuxR C-terminal-related transcriptional regulator [Cupriavidus sp. LEh21]
MKMTKPALQDAVDYGRAFAHMPAAMMITRQRIITDCNLAFLSMFRAAREQLVGQSVRVLYPNQVDFERFGKRVIPILAQHGRFTDSRLMKRLDNDLFWVNVAGASEYRDDPYAEALWMFAEMADDEAVPVGTKGKGVWQIDSQARSAMTRRERDVATLLIDSKTAKEIGKALGISPRTVEIYRSRLLRKFNVPSTPELVEKLLS